MQPASDWLLWQLADSAFPTGGFAHSGGLEAAWQLGLVERASLGAFLASTLEHAAAGALPLVGAVHDEPGAFAAMDALADASLTNHVANRASRAQGAALLATSASAFGLAEVVSLRARALRSEWPQHAAPSFGLVARALGVERGAACRLFVFQAMRGLVSAAVRLGAVGPLAAQSLQHRLGAAAEEVAVSCAARSPDDVAQASPLVEVFQGQQDRLYSRLFSS